MTTPILPEQITLLQIALLLEAEGLKEHPAPWLKNSKSVFRGPGGRFASKSGESDGSGGKRGSPKDPLPKELASKVTQNLKAGFAASIAGLKAQNDKIAEQLSEWEAPEVAKQLNQRLDDFGEVLNEATDELLKQPFEDIEKEAKRFLWHAGTPKRYQGFKEKAVNNIVSGAKNAVKAFGIGLAATAAISVASPLLGAGLATSAAIVTMSAASDFAVMAFMGGLAKTTTDAYWDFSDVSIELGENSERVKAGSEFLLSLCLGSEIFALPRLGPILGKKASSKAYQEASRKAAEEAAREAAKQSGSQGMKEWMEILDLGDIPKDAQELRKAWKAAARKYHPDLNTSVPKDVATKQMQDVNEAFEQLMKRMGW